MKHLILICFIHFVFMMDIGSRNNFYLKVIFFKVLTFKNVFLITLIFLKGLSIYQMLLFILDEGIIFQILKMLRCILFAQMSTIILQSS